MTARTFSSTLLAIPRVGKRALALCGDAILCALTVWIAFSLYWGDWETQYPVRWMVTMGAIALMAPIFVRFGLYRAIFRYAGFDAVLAIIRAVALYGLTFSFVITVIGIADVPRAVGVVQPLLLLVGVTGTRVVARSWLGGWYSGRRRVPGSTRVLIYGAGAAGRQLVAALRNSRELTPVCFVDDDPTLQGNTINGLMVYRRIELADRVHALDITDVLLAIPSAHRDRRNEILDALRPLNVRVRTLPGLIDLARGRVATGDLRELDVEDLLGRAPVPPKPELLNKLVQGKVVLVTGAGGSIGSEICRQIARLQPRMLLLFEVSEFALYTIHQELSLQIDAPQLIPLLGSVTDRRRVDEVMSTWQPETVYHAAAYKHVPLVEHNPAEGLRNNVIGTATAAESAAAHGVSHFVLISTDKAVRPTNVMGASKRLAEQVLQALAATQPSNGTCFAMVRFGNVLDSSGSVVPLFRKQIREGGPLTVTHSEITRYFMTIPEAAQLVIQSGAMAHGGEVFVLDMGEPVRIVDLAQRMIDLSGLTQRIPGVCDGDIEIVVTGLRPGEKLYEELLIGDNPEPTEHPRILKAHETFLPWRELQTSLQALQEGLQRNDVPRMRELLKKLVPGYEPAESVVDWVHTHRLGNAAETVPQLRRAS